MTTCDLARALAIPVLVGYLLASFTGDSALGWAGGVVVGAVMLAVDVLRRRKGGAACGPACTALSLRRPSRQHRAGLPRPVLDLPAGLSDRSQASEQATGTTAGSPR
jgi:hypothetical protein